MPMAITLQLRRWRSLMKVKNAVLSGPKKHIPEEPTAIPDLPSLAVYISPDPAASSSEADSLDRRIGELAYRLYEDRGRIDGFDLEDWLEAESMVRENGKFAA
jgi:hypothetical protein